MANVQQPKHLVPLTKTDAAAFRGVCAEIKQAEAALERARAEGDAVVLEIIASHKAPAQKPGTPVSLVKTADGSVALAYEVAPVAVPASAPVVEAKATEA